MTTGTRTDMIAETPGHLGWRTQSLASGTLADALVAVEYAHHTSDWTYARTLIQQAVAAPVSAADTTGLYLGAPAVTFLLHAAARGTDRYTEALAVLDRHIADLVSRRVAAATARLDVGRPPVFGEYDVFYGLTGVGALLLHRSPGSDGLERILTHLVRLTEPLQLDRDTTVPGWWVSHDPAKQQSASFPGGHANVGLAHGIPGPLALLALAARAGVVVDRHHEAMGTILDWLHTWQQDSPAGVWWPETVNIAEHHTGRSYQRRPGRPSWCYGTPGIARAGQLAAIALGDTQTQALFEDSLTACLDDDAQTRQIRDAGICHGWAGIHATLRCAAADALTPDLAARLPVVAGRLHHVPAADDGEGFLTGPAGIDLARLTADTDSATRWETCLLIA
jgi:hypothetical protein